MATFQMNYLSTMIGMQTNFTAFIPSYTPNEENAGTPPAELYPRGKKYKVLWLLHSDNGDDSELLKYTNILRYAQKHDLAVIMPCGYNMMYSDDPHGQKFSKLISKELFTMCHNYFPLSDKPEDNYIGGISLGAYGALKIALFNPEQYSKVMLIDGGFSENMTGNFLAALQAHAVKEGMIAPFRLDDALLEETELYNAACKAVEIGAKLPEFCMAWGSENKLTGTQSRDGAALLKKLGYKISSKEYAGCGRDWDFWDAALKDLINGWLISDEKEEK